MKKLMTPANRGLAFGILLILAGLAISAIRFSTSNGRTDSLFFINIFTLAAGIAVISQVVVLARRRNESHG